MRAMPKRLPSIPKLSIDQPSFVLTSSFITLLTPLTTLTFVCVQLRLVELGSATLVVS